MYENPFYGRLTAEVRDGRLVLDLGPRPMPIQTRHWDGDTFAIAVPGYGAPKFTDGLVSFQFGLGDTATGLSFVRAFADVADGRFTRTADH
jgi:hypothetical protein